MGLHQTPLLIVSLLLCIGSGSGLSARRRCPPSYCGNLQISYPFRLKSDKPTCGDRRYELTCDRNRTIIDINSGKYYVKSISYSMGYEYIQITDVGLASGDCALPSNTLTLDTIYRDERFTFTFSASHGSYGVFALGEATFVNCTREIQSWHYRQLFSSTDFPCPSGSTNFVNCALNRKGWLYRYSHVPCLSGSNALVYVIFSDYERGASVEEMAPTCRFLAMVPRNLWDFDTAEMNEDVFKYLQNGISLKWANPSCDPMPSVLKYCFVHAYGISKGVDHWQRAKWTYELEMEQKLLL